MKITVLGKQTPYLFIIKYTTDIEQIFATFRGIFCDIPWVMETFI